VNRNFQRARRGHGPLAIWPRSAGPHAARPTAVWTLALGLFLAGAATFVAPSAAQRASRTPCAPWGGELDPLPTIADADPVLARWARLRTQDLAREAELLESVDVARAHAVWRHAACLSSADPEVVRGIARTVPVRVYRPVVEQVRARSAPVPLTLKGALARLADPVQFAVDELAARSAQPATDPPVMPARSVVPARLESGEATAQRDESEATPTLPPPVPPQRERPSGTGASFSPGPAPEQPQPPAEEPETAPPPAPEDEALPPELPDALLPSVSARGPADAVIRARDALREARYEAVLAIADESRERTPAGADRAALEFAAGSAAIALGRAERARESFARVLEQDGGFAPDRETTSPKVLRVFEQVERAGGRR
jgi:hypothetical protein